MPRSRARRSQGSTAPGEAGFVPAVAGQDDLDVGRLLVQDVATHDGHTSAVGAGVELYRRGGEGIDVGAGSLGRAGTHRRDRAQPGAGCQVEHAPTRHGLRPVAQVPAIASPPAHAKAQ